MAYGNTYSSGSTFSRQNWSTQSSFSWNTGSVEKSHAIVCPPSAMRVHEPTAPTDRVGVGRPGDQLDVRDARRGPALELGRAGQCANERYSWTDRTAAEASPTAAATRFVDPERRSPTAKRPGWLVSNGSGRRLRTAQRSSSWSVSSERSVITKPCSSRTAHP